MAQFVNRTYDLGENVILECIVDGGPDNTLRWQFNGLDIAIEPVLMISNVNALDGGEYTCVVSNAAGSDSANTFLYVAPYFITQPMDTPTNYGGTVNLTCEAEAFPSPEYQWQRADGELIMNAIMTNASMLVIEPVVFDNQGDYYCVVSSLNETEVSQTVTITGNNHL